MKFPKTYYWAIFLAFFLALLIKIFAFDIMIAEGASMEPTIPSGSLIFVNRLAYGLRLPFASRFLFLWKTPKRGDILVFQAPDGRLAIKRCLISAGEEDPAFDTPPPRTLLVLGDNSTDSWDSRSYGPISYDRVYGKVAFYR